jgi:hypothetical protein
LVFSSKVPIKLGSLAIKMFKNCVTFCLIIINCASSSVAVIKKDSAKFEADTPKPVILQLDHFEGTTKDNHLSEIDPLHHEESQQRNNAWSQVTPIIGDPLLQAVLSSMKEAAHSTPISLKSQLTPEVTNVEVDDFHSKLIKLKEQAQLYRMINDMLKAETMVQAQPYNEEHSSEKDPTPVKPKITTTTVAPVLEQRPVKKQAKKQRQPVKQNIPQQHETPPHAIQTPQDDHYHDNQNHHNLQDNRNNHQDSNDAHHYSHPILADHHSHNHPEHQDYPQYNQHYDEDNHNYDDYGHQHYYQNYHEPQVPQPQIPAPPKNILRQPEGPGQRRKYRRERQ